MADKYSCLYKIECTIQCKPGEDSSYYVSLTSSDLVSISYIHNYDVAVFPIIRVRLYVDLTVFEKVVEYPDDVYVVLTYNPVICNMNYQQDNGNGSIQVVDSGKPNTIRYKAYLENKNTPTSIMDSYEKIAEKIQEYEDEFKQEIIVYTPTPGKFLHVDYNDMYTDKGVCQKCSYTYTQQDEGSYIFSDKGDRILFGII